MRALVVAAALLLSGCVVPDLLQTSSIQLALPEVPEGAVVETIQGGLRVVFDAVELPLMQNLTIPEGTTLVRVTGIVGDDETVGVSLRHAETERRRCNFAPGDSWDTPFHGRAQCTGVTMVDRLPALWQVRAGSPAGTARVEVELLTTPIDGPLAQLDTSQLSMRDFELEEPEPLRLPSFDGTELYAELTLPKGPGPWPTIIVSSPYNHNDPLLPPAPSDWTYVVRDWAERGYAFVAADVRGYGWSDGCVEVWGTNEQRDQAFLVEWAASQPWSDGNVGFYGQSYVATTPVEAAVQAPDALKAIIAVAPVTDSYNDWHFGGVPNGENLASPRGYQETGGVTDLPLFDPRRAGPDTPSMLASYAEARVSRLPATADRADNGFCDPTLAARANDPRAIYDGFYEERNFSARAADVRAAVLYTQGFQDSNVKSAEIPDWFNALQVPKLGLFGQWVHQHPTRADNEALFLLWFDQYVKGKPVGFEKLPATRTITNDGRERVGDAWPPIAPGLATLHLDLEAGALALDPAQGQATVRMDPIEGSLPASIGTLPVANTAIVLESAPLAAPIHFAGQAQVQVSATLDHAENAFVAASLYEEKDGETRRVTWGMFNLAHRNGHDRYDPVTPGERVSFGIPLLPIEWVFAEGSVLRLEIRGARVEERGSIPTLTFGGLGEPADLTIYADASALELPLAPDGGALLPATAQR